MFIFFTIRLRGLKFGIGTDEIQETTQDAKVSFIKNVRASLYRRYSE